MKNNSFETIGRNCRRSRILAMLEALRASLIRVGLALLVVSVVIFPFADDALRWIQQRAGAPLAAFGVADAFLALVSISLGLGSTAVMPYAVHEALSAAAAGFPALSRRTRWICFVFAVALFSAGVWFCLGITLPYGCRFLLGYATQDLQPVISVRKFVSFCMILTLGFGVLFELPLIMALSAWLHVVRVSMMARYRKYAVVLIMAVSAIVTPTPDILNLLLLAAPLYFLYEIGILGMRICEGKRGTGDQDQISSTPVGLW